MDIDTFLETVRRYTDATEITQCMAAELIDHIQMTTLKSRTVLPPSISPSITTVLALSPFLAAGKYQRWRLPWIQEKE
ncbi:DUF4368 domain-containing protein [uncultured Oscillibacter sp.]|uniref:DUF4368 domain-containing protein n=1 Tax=uncultured Oscillibacter sp. TaxID=876091 RepID=UPI00266EB886|nr:DUF4368 domain-containing protein [uncultured Oscillibacter sp.]